MKNFALAACLTAALLTGTVAAPAFAFDENSMAAVNVDDNGLGLRGYDPVAYIAVGTPVEGLGIFGAPSFIVGDELFWGDDRLDDALLFAKGAS